MINPQAISFLDPLKKEKDNGYYYHGETNLHTYMNNYTIHNHNIELYRLHRFGDSSQLYYSVNPTPIAQPFPLSILMGYFGKLIVILLNTIQQ